MKLNKQSIGVIVIVLLFAGIVSWFLVSKQLQNNAELMQKNVEVGNDGQRQEAQVLSSKENKKKNKKAKVSAQGCSGEMVNMVVDDGFLECSFCPKVGESIIKWCDDNKQELKNNYPDCDLFFCGRGGTNLGRNYKKYKGRVYYWNENHGQAVWDAELLKDADMNTFQVLYDNPFFESRCMARDKKDGEIRYFYETKVYSDKKCGLTE